LNHAPENSENFSAKLVYIQDYFRLQKFWKLAAHWAAQIMRVRFAVFYKIIFLKREFMFSHTNYFHPNNFDISKIETFVEGFISLENRILFFFI